MSEIITTYHLDNSWEAHPMERAHFYDEQIEEFKKHGKPTRACGVVNVLLFTEKKEIIVQKRSHTKRHNPFLIDKAMGGHIKYGDTPYYTAMIECVQELRMPAVVLRENENFTTTYEALNKSIESAAILKCIHRDIYQFEKIFDNEKIMIANNVWLFFGIYGGPIKPMDREASGVMYYERDVLKEEMRRMPELFTNDLHFFLDKYETQIDNFLKILD